jgi:protein-S-isoprenylcysteine O-methyltransferase Ste14
MNAERIISWLPLASLIGFLCIVIIRTIMLGRRGIRARVRDSNRSRTARIIETASGIVFWMWVWMVVEFTWPPPPTWFPHWLTFQLVDSPVAKWIGAAFVIIPVIVYPITLADMGNSWRMGIDRQAHNPSSTDSSRPPSTLVTHGLFRFARNPIYVIVDLLFFGTFLILGQIVFLIFAVAFALLIHLQVLREERFLAERYGEQYEAYRRRVRRYGVF